MAGSFDALFELHGLPAESGTEHVGNAEEFDALMSGLAEVSTYRGEALLNRVLAAHPPGLPSGNRDDEFIASHPLAAAAVVELYSDIARNSSVFAPIVLGKSLETSEDVLYLLKDIRCVVQEERRCKLMWQQHIFRGFVDLSRKNRGAAAQQIVGLMKLHREARAEASRRIDVMLRRSKEARDSGQVFCLESMEDVWLVILAQQARKHSFAMESLDQFETLGAVALVEDFAAKQPGGRIDAFDFAAADVASIMLRISAREHKLGPTLLESLIDDLAANGHFSICRGYLKETKVCNQPETMRVMLHRVLSQPRALPLFFRFVNENSTTGFGYGLDLVALFTSAIASDRSNAEMTVREALALCKSQFSEDSIAVLEKAVELFWTIKLRRGELEPDHFLWFSRLCPEIQSAVIATGIYSRPNANEDAPRPTQAAAAAAIESVLVILKRNPWFVRNTLSSTHPYHSIKSHAVNLLVVGEHLMAELHASGDTSYGGAEEIALRFKNYWKSIFLTDGPPEDCPHGYNGCMFDGSCMSCGMPSKYCPSLFRLTVEIREYMARNRKNDGAVTEVSLSDASAVVESFHGGEQFPGAPEEVQEAAEMMVAEGLVQIDRRHSNWSFPGPKQPVQFVSSRNHRHSKLAMKPIT